MFISWVSMAVYRFRLRFSDTPSSFAHPGAVDIDLTAECEQLGKFTCALDLVQGPQKRCQPGCALRAGAQVTFLMKACRFGSRTTFGVKLATPIVPSRTAAATI